MPEENQDQKQAQVAEKSSDDSPTQESSGDESHKQQHGTSKDDPNIPAEINPSTPIEPKSYENAEHDSFFAFVPKLIGYGTGIVGRECKNAQQALCGFPQWSKQYGKETYSFYKENPRTFYKEVISGFTVAIMQVPESIAFSFVAGKVVL